MYFHLKPCNKVSQRLLTLILSSSLPRSRHLWLWHTCCIGPHCLDLYKGTLSGGVNQGTELTMRSRMHSTKDLLIHKLDVEKKGFMIEQEQRFWKQWHKNYILMRIWVFNNSFLQKKKQLCLTDRQAESRQDYAS